MRPIANPAQGSIHRVPMTALEEAVAGEVAPHLAMTWRPDVSDGMLR